MKEPSITALTEEELVKRMYGDLRCYGNLAVPAQMPKPFAYRLGVKPPALGLRTAAFGDIDALLVPSGHPELSRAVQYKRVKIQSRTFAKGGKPNNLQGIQELAQQSNDLVRAGFAHVWAMVVVVVDSRERNAEQSGDAVSFEGATMELSQQVAGAIRLPDFRECVGVDHAEIVQPMDRAVEVLSAMGSHLLRLSKAQQQPAYLTDAISRSLETSEEWMCPIMIL